MDGMDLSLLGLTLAIILFAIVLYLQGKLIQRLIDSFSRIEHFQEHYSQHPFSRQEEYILKHIPMTFYTDIGSSDIQREEKETTTIKIEPVEEEGLSSETL